ncbi:hypothetical protein AHAS_Ahas13G0316800 [Arachis hypogaea]
MINKLHSTIRGPYTLVGRIPPSLENLSSLETLSLAYNHLEGNIPHVMGRLSNLNSIFLGSNNLSGMIPPSLYNLFDIRDFDLGKNQLVGVNSFRGPIPLTLGIGLNKLQQLIMGYNNFGSGQAIPETVGRSRTRSSVLVGDDVSGWWVAVGAVVSDLRDWLHC